MLHDVFDGYKVGIKYLPIILKFIGEKRVSDANPGCSACINVPGR
jgi:hypothetical protein